MKDRRLLAVCAGQLLGIAGIDAALVLMPALLADMGVSGDAPLVAWSGGAQAAAFLLSLAATPLWGRLGDRVGRARMLARAHAGLALSLALMAWARSPWELVLARAAQGVLAGTTPAALALAAGGADGAARMGWVRSAGLGGAFLGPLLGGLLAPALGASRVMALAALVSALLAALVLLESRGETAAPAEKERGAPFAPAAFGQAAALSYFRSLEDPLLPVFVRSLAPSNWTLWAGVCLSASRLAQMLTAPHWGRVVDRRGPDAALAPCLVGAGLATAAQALVPGAAALAAVRLALGAFASGVVAALYARGARDAGDAGRGEAVAWTSSGLRLGNGLANATAGAAAAALGAPGLFALAGAGLIGAGAAFAAKKREDACAASCSTGI